MFPKDRITEFDWPNAHADAIGQYAPKVYGTHDSTGDTGQGMIPAYYVDTSGFRYALAVGYLKDVRAVYVDGTKEDSANYAITNPTVNGRQWTLIDFTSDQASSVITADVDGYEEAANGTGTLITNPVRQIEHCFENFIWGDYKSGAWLNAQAPIADGAFSIAADFCDVEGYEGAIYIAGDQLKGRDFFNSWLETFDARAYWTRQGELAVLFLNHAEVDLYKDNATKYRWIRWEEHEMGYSGRLNVEGVASRITVRYVNNSVEGALKHSLEVRDLSIDDERADSVDLTYGPARLV
jgi:hypothetical protein